MGMKILKRAVQKNFIVDTCFYTGEEVNELVSKGTISQLDDDKNYRIFTSDCKEVKFICDYDGFYQPVVVTNNGEIIHIKA